MKERVRPGYGDRVSEKENARVLKALAIFNKVQPLITNLYGRWIDESKYEDIETYQWPIRNVLTNFEGARFAKVCKRPFGFEYWLEGCLYKVSHNSRECSFKRIT